MKPRIVSAIVRRELSSYFASPTGYVFITIFIFLSAFAAFWLPDFFTRNLANLDQLNAWFPMLLLLIIPAITMGAWAEERRQGTEDLLLTLPARDWQLVLGKYLACLLIYTAAVGFSLSHILVLAFLGEPDVGLMLSTYLGYWLSGAGLLAIGLVASALTSNLTISFILAAVFCALIVGAGAFRGIFPGTLVAEVAEQLSLPARFIEFGKGVIAIQNVAYFAMLAAFGLWLNSLIISRRHWGGSTGSTQRMSLSAVRAIAFVVAAGALITILARTPLRADATAERLWSISPETRELVGAIDPEDPVLITAYVSPEVPAAMVQTRETLIGMLRELDAARGGARIVVRIVDTEPFTEEARQAQRSYGIAPQPIPSGPRDPRQGLVDVFMGVAFSRGPEQFVIPFLLPGLPVEYELARSIRRVSAAERKKIGIVSNDLNVLGGFDYQTYTSTPPWPVVPELRKQYDVETVTPGQTNPSGLDVMIVMQPSLLTDDELEPILESISAGVPTILMEDPMPIVSPGFATQNPRGAEQNPFQRQQQPDDRPKANLEPLWAMLGAEIPGGDVVWDSYDPRPQLGTEAEVIFVTPNSVDGAFNPTEAVTSGLQEVVFLLPGHIRLRDGAEPVATPLVRISPDSGTTPASTVLQRTFFGYGGFNPARRRVPTPESHILAAHVRSPEGADASINVILIPDIDFGSESFFQIRAQGAADLNLDNVTLLLNCVDVLAGDESLVELRKRRPAYRTLTTLDDARRDLTVVKDSTVEEASRQAEDELVKARAVLQRKVQELEQRQDLDETTRSIMIEQTRRTEQRRLDVQTASIEDAKQVRINEAETEARQAIEGVQTRIRLLAVLLPPIPALALAGIVFIRRRSQELEGVARERLR